ncbi:spermidine/putrescine ABC transporter permease [Candidatus Aerophobetes bacterium]|uniref:Spermidine/putrescine ABC transporter permease n=1 Tax=Aerophobetes bacterium TaxID=2030807 RepID=A0A2A4X6M5_UNCAE|nr:MAG: spermidine/putrescine ABC transporter permease [Candidatus Aerophobetes bacterium]
MVSMKINNLFSKQDKLFALGSPAIAWQIIFFYLPLTLLLISSFFIQDIETGAISTFSLTHFSVLFSPSHFSALFNSLWIAIFTSVGCFFLAFPLAMFLAFYGKKYKNILLTLLIIPFWSNFLLHVYAWFFILEREGLINNLLLSMHLIKTPIHFLNSGFATMVMMIYCYLPFMVLPIYSALDRFDLNLFEASENLGASKKATFFNILIPLTLPSLRAGFFLVFIPAFGEFIIPELMGGNKQIFVGTVVSNYIMGSTTTHLGAGFFLISFAFLTLTSFLLYIGLKKISNRLMSRGIRA